MPKPNCCHCKDDFSVLMRRQITTNGVSQVAWYCTRCERWAENPVVWQKHDDLKARLARQGNTIEDIPIVADYTSNTHCKVCGRPGEYHHWAPQSMSEEFGEEWSMWPGDYLCERHHQQWHILVTPGLTTWHFPEKERING